MDYVQTMIALCQREDDVKWERGDLLVAAEALGETSEAEVWSAAEEMGVSYNVLATERWVAREFPRSERRDLTWTHHRLVAGMKDTKTRNAVLDMCVEGSWSASTLRSFLESAREDDKKEIDATGTGLEDYLAQSWRQTFPNHAFMADDVAAWAATSIEHWHEQNTEQAQTG